MARCTRCGQAFEDPESLCRYHPGNLLDYDLARPKSYLYGQGGGDGDFWDCCNQMIPDPGCSQGPHTTEVTELRRGIVPWHPSASKAEVEEEYQRRLALHQSPL